MSPKHTCNFVYRDPNRIVNCDPIHEPIRSYPGEDRIVDRLAVLSICLDRIVDRLAVLSICLDRIVDRLAIQNESATSDKYTCNYVYREPMDRKTRAEPIRSRRGSDRGSARDTFHPPGSDRGTFHRGGSDRGSDREAKVTCVLLSEYYKKC
ncbi:hypothetical protein Fcan01_17367 [Folsomia candida]|uniref:Uncharacterized protein n=1 Tax=Folsomia candida TaxID=158441 RepID=A0A226DT57_FOLCA|nr:hypothetical protein Fcan01_17367 [Folsomia candida]